MILSKSAIQEELKNENIICATEEDIRIYYPNTLKTQSIDVRLGQYVWVWKETEFVLIDLDHEVQQASLNSYIQAAMRKDIQVFLLAHTEEFIGTKAGSGILPTFKLKSSAGRQGIMHTLAGHGDEGFINRWAMEFTIYRPVELERYMSIGQIYFTRLEGESESYGQVGSYQSGDDLEEIINNWTPEVLLPKPFKVIKEI